VYDKPQGLFVREKALKSLNFKSRKTNARCLKKMLFEIKDNILYNFMELSFTIGNKIIKHIR